ncbi:hypothetical protein MMC12_008402 [Toensbergia leucococca]|nr:hypothetical protein [Toensbergia leucococca]
MSGPLLIVLHLVPQGVLAGLFFIMGFQALEGNGITLKLLYLCRDKTLTQVSEPLSRVRRKQAIWYFVTLELVGFGMTFAITQTIAAIGFPIIILLLVPVRTFLLPRFFTPEELSMLDAPTASPFTMESVGGNYGDDGNELPINAEPRVTTAANGGEDVVETRKAGKARDRDSQRRTNFREKDYASKGEHYEMQRFPDGGQRSRSLGAESHNN